MLLFSASRTKYRSSNYIPTQCYWANYPERDDKEWCGLQLFKAKDQRLTAFILVLVVHTNTPSWAKLFHFHLLAEHYTSILKWHHILVEFFFLTQNIFVGAALLGYKIWYMSLRNIPLRNILLSFIKLDIWHSSFMLLWNLTFSFSFLLSYFLIYFLVKNLFYPSSKRIDPIPVHPISTAVSQKLKKQGENSQHYVRCRCLSSFKSSASDG